MNNPRAADPIVFGPDNGNVQSPSHPAEIDTIAAQMFGVSFNRLTPEQWRGVFRAYRTCYQIEISQ